jgi:hypothetical protein
MDYKTLDKFKTIIDDPSAAPAERAFAQAQLNKAATALVVLNSNKSNWRQRVEARTATVVQEEQDKRIAIVERAEKRARDAAEEQIHREIRIDKARSDHSVYMTNAKDTLRDAKFNFLMRDKQRIDALLKLGIDPSVLD